MPEAVRVGPAGWSYKDWSRIVYPWPRPKGFDEARYLADFFDTIELNMTFYRPATPSMVRRWMYLVSNNPRFLFTAKLWQRFTHEGELTASNEGEFRPGMEVLRDAGKLGALLAQFPWSFKNVPDSREYLEKLTQRLRDFPLVIEVRHASRNDPAFYEWLTEQGIGFCNIDQPLIGRSLRPSERATAPVGYVRLHGRNYKEWFSEREDDSGAERYNYLYSMEELKPWAERIQNVVASTEIAFVITNNHYQGKAVVNAFQLRFLLEKRPVKVPSQVLIHYPELGNITFSEDAALPLFPSKQPPAH